MAEVKRKTTTKKTTVAKAKKARVKAKMVSEEGKSKANLENIAKDVKQAKGNVGTASFVYMDDVKNILDVTLATGKNCILHGKGGYGKSEYAMAYFEEKGIKPYVITMGSGMTTDRLFGGVDLLKFNETGKIEYLIENSFMNNEYVIFEELFDAPDFILEQLKDILSSGVFRNGTQVFEIKTKTIICCTNKTREEFAKNLSLRALMERFPLELEVKWDNHNRLTYQNLLETKFGKGNADPLLTYVLEHFAVKGQTLSPRIAIVASDVMAECGPSCLQFIADFQHKDDLLKDAFSKFKAIAEINSMTESIENEIRDLAAHVKEGLGSKQDVTKAVNMNKALDKSITKLSKIKADDAMAVETATKVKKFQELQGKFTKTISITETVAGIEEFI
jgi:MoxR-like ATPase